jgi:hypothetical protein
MKIRGAGRSATGAKGATGKLGHVPQGHRESGVNEVRKGLPNPDCVVKVGDGRGFIIVYRAKVPPIVPPLKPIHGRRPLRFIEQRLVVTAAHCLALSIPCHAAAYSEERMCTRLGTLDGGKKDVWAECLFVDPIADIAVLGQPDEQGFSDQADAYTELTENASFTRIGIARSGRGWILSLAGQWVRTTLKVNQGIGCVGLSIGPTDAGMSGSPILNDSGRAIGVVVIGAETYGQQRDLSGPHPILVRNLPGWLLSSSDVTAY